LVGLGLFGVLLGVFVGASVSGLIDGDVVPRSSGEPEGSGLSDTLMAMFVLWQTSRRNIACSSDGIGNPCIDIDPSTDRLSKLDCNSFGRSLNVILSNALGSINLTKEVYCAESNL
jgi:hypothetical protein